MSPFLLRPQLRAVLGQSKPRFDILDVFTKRRILLVDCSKGALGPETSALLASSSHRPAVGRHLVAQRHSARRADTRSASTWTSTRTSCACPPISATPSPRPGVSVSRSPWPNQYLHQLDASMRSAVLANVQNKICFRLADEDARVLATRGSGLEPEDFASLGRVPSSTPNWSPAGQSSHGAAPGRCPLMIPSATLRKCEPRPGRPMAVLVAEIEDEIRSLAWGRRKAGADDLGRRRRSDGGER